MTHLTGPKSKDFRVQERYRKDYEKLKEQLLAYTKRAYFVGGCVRDFFLGLESDDYDIEVYDIGEEEFALLMDNFGALRVGKSFNVYKWSVFDIALPRTETKTGKGHTAFNTSLSGDEKRASIRRDFTMNALMIDIFSLELLDFWGGAEDIKNKTIKLIDSERFQEDSLRVLRAMQFAARFGFKVDEKTIRVCLHIPLSDLSYERVFFEFQKMFVSDYLHFGLYYAIRLDILNKLFNIDIHFKEFVSLTKKIRLDLAYIESEKKEYFFLYNLYNTLQIPLRPMLEKLHAPKRYHKTLLAQKRRPKMITRKFLLALSLKQPIKEWFGADSAIAEEAKELGVYEKSFEHGILISDVIKEGFIKEQIKREYKRRVCGVLRNTG